MKHTQDLWVEKYKMLVKKNQRQPKEMERHSMLMDWETLRSKDADSPQNDLEVYCNSYQNPSKVICRHRQAYSQIPTEGTGSRHRRYL